jgi:hypothetical protein
MQLDLIIIVQVEEELMARQHELPLMEGGKRDHFIRPWLGNDVVDRDVTPLEVREKPLGVQASEAGL